MGDTSDYLVLVREGNDSMLGLIVSAYRLNFLLLPPYQPLV